MKLRENFEAGGEEMIGAAQNPGEWAVSVIPGSGLPADQVELRDTNVSAYINNPDLARMEQENALARWGGKAIDGSYLDEETGKVVHPAPAGGPPDKSNAPYSRPRMDQEGTFEYNRREFERSIFKEIGGNPFEIDVMKEVDKATAQDLPYLFRNVFGGRLIWEDRRRMDEKQKKFWDDEVKKYRSYVKERIESDKKMKTDLYNQMTRQFDNEQKEYEAASKKVAEREKQWRERYEKDQEKKSRAETELGRTVRDMDRAERDILKDMNTILKGDGGKVTPEQAQMAKILGAQLQELRQQRHAYRMGNDKGYRTKIEGEQRQQQSDADQNRIETSRSMPADPGAKGKAAGKEGEKTAKISGFSIKVGPEGPPVEVRKLRDGTLVGRYADGSKRVIEEAAE